MGVYSIEKRKNMATLNGIKIQNAYLDGSNEEAFVKLILANGAIYGSYKVWNDITDEEVEKVDASLAFTYDGDFELETKDWYHIRNTYGSSSWSRSDEISLMDDAERALYGY